MDFLGQCLEVAANVTHHRFAEANMENHRMAKGDANVENHRLAKGEANVENHWLAKGEANVEHHHHHRCANVIGNDDEVM